MYGVVSLLDDKHTRIVDDLWDEFKAKFGVHGVHRTPIAHFSYHVAESYDLEALRNVLMPIVNDIRPFRVRTTGLGIFTGEIPVLFVPVNPNPELLALHQRLWEVISTSNAFTTPLEYYHPHRWHPHITLTHHDVNHEMLPQVVRLLSERDFSWEIDIDNLAVLDGSDEVHTLEYRLHLNG